MLASDTWPSACELSGISGMTESGYKPIGVAVIVFYTKAPAKGIKGYRGFAAPASELR